jgi:2-polyprenyl-3-methyl-5-hydroxy-6-metoxy-1,4-benzoquinol methylase
MSNVSKQNTTENIDGSWYVTKYLPFDKKLIEFRYRSIKPYIKPGRGLELGSAQGDMTEFLVKHFDTMVSVDGSRELLDIIPHYPNHKKVHSYFENYEPNETYDTIIMEHILEHVTDPVTLLSRVRTWLAPGGVLIIGVPNAKSFHRLAAVKMNMLKSIYELNERDHEVGHQRVYCTDTLHNDVKKAGLTIIKHGGGFLKPLSNKQINDTWTDEIIEGFYQLGCDFPEHAADIFVICKA